MPMMINGREIILSGAVGDDMGWGWGDCFTAGDVIMALAQVGNGNDVTIRLNSAGGIATEGSAIHAAISRHAGKTTVIVEGIAASAASVVAMAGDEVVMALGALMMVHDPATFTVGTVKDHQEQINSLTAIGDAMATIYAAKTGQTAEVCRADMSAELWMTADQAVAKGYADRVEGAPETADEPQPMAFNYGAYARAPAPLMALAKAKQWDERKPKPTAQADPPKPDGSDLPPHKDSVLMPETTQDTQAAEAAVNARIEAAVAAALGVASAASMPRAQAAEIVKACVDGGVPALASALIAEGVTLEQAKARVTAAGHVKDIVALARRADPSIADDFAATMIAEGKTGDQVKAILFDKLAAKAEEAAPVSNIHRAGAGGTDVAGGDANARAQSKARMKAELQRQGMLPKEG
jgi:ATP-dependent Clp protease, protease subunit